MLDGDALADKFRVARLHKAAKGIAAAARQYDLQASRVEWRLACPSGLPRASNVERAFQHQWGARDFILYPLEQKPKNKKNLGISFELLCFSSCTLTWVVMWAVVCGAGQGGLGRGGVGWGGGVAWGWVGRCAWEGLGWFDKAGLDKVQTQGVLKLHSLGSLRHMVAQLVRFD